MKKLDLASIFLAWLKETFPKDWKGFSHHRYNGPPNEDVHKISAFTTQAIIGFRGHDLCCIGADWIWWTPPVIMPGTYKNVQIMHAHELDFGILKGHIATFIETRRYDNRS